MNLFDTAEGDIKVIFKDTEAALTTDIGPATTATKSALGSLLTKKVDIFGATIPLNKKVTKKVIELGSIAVLAIGLIGTQVYTYKTHQDAIQESSARIGTVESLAKQTDTNFVNVNAAIIATNKLVASTNTKVDALAAKVAADEAKLTPVRPTSAVTRKYYRKK